MDVVIRPVGDRFLKEVAFPAFEVGMVDAAAGLDQLRQSIQDPQTLTLIEMLIDRGVEGSFFSLDSNQWLETVYRLIFSDWKKTRDGGWVMAGEFVGYAGSLEQTLNIALMLEEPRYPYSEAAKARELRNTFMENPEPHFGIASLVGGSWFPVPTFAPDQVISNSGRGMYAPQDEIAFADWAHRPTSTVKVWNAQLGSKMEKLLEREARRLAPIEIPERDEILGYWMGQLNEPPVLAVCFSALGPTAQHWIREIGVLARVIRAAAERDHGLTSIISAPTRAMGDNG
ncbi:MAG: hypothetical protein ACJ790_19435 [Myxococcaceae bacterium]